MKSIAKFEEGVQLIRDVFNDVYYMQVMLEQTAEAIDFTADDWSAFHKAHPQLSWCLMKIEDKYGKKEIV